VFGAHCSGYNFPAESRLQRGERESAIGAELPGKNFAVEDGRSFDSGKPFCQSWEAGGYVFASAGENAYASGVMGITTMHLGAHAVIFVFNLGGRFGF